MKSSNTLNSVIAKYSHILTGIVFTATSVLPLATSAIAQTATPALTITANTRTPLIPASSEVIYRITVVATSAAAAKKVKITAMLPTGFTYDKELTMLTNKAVIAGTKPTNGANTLIWDNYTIPASGSINIFFTAKASATPGAYSMRSLKVDYYKSDTGTPVITNPTDPLSVATTSATSENVTLKPIPPTPTLTIAPSTGSTTTVAPICGQPGSQGLGVDLTGIVNTYYKPTMQSVAAGTKIIEIASGAAKGVAHDIKPGDLVLIAQMQDASINITNTEAYGSGSTTNQGSGQTSMGSSGLYEYAIADSTVLAASGNVNLTLTKPLINTYTSAAATTTSGQKRFQVIRVPQYASAKILGTLYASPWDGNVGGIFAVDAFGTFDFNNQRISVNEAGFRGGYGPRNSYQSASTGFVAQTASTLGSGKGEGVAGTPRYLATKSLSNVDPTTKAPIWTGGFTDNGTTNGYPGGDTGRGAPANAGGGADYHNAGGGGGGNGGNGGQGGLPWEGSPTGIQDAGGRPGSSSLTNIPTPVKVFMGGGGGGGEANDAPAGVPGGAGGGIVMLRAGTIVGSGTIYANGTNGDRGSYQANPDGAGGGGAGGTVLIQSRNPSAPTIDIQAKGGNGGNTEQDAFYDYVRLTPVTIPANQNSNDGYSPIITLNGVTTGGYPYSSSRAPHGPGGGGAGGIILYNVTTANYIQSNALVTGGLSGHSDDPSPNSTLAPRGGKTQNSHGATAGSSGQLVRFTGGDDLFSDLNAQTACSPANLAMLVSTSTPTAAPGDVVSYKMSVTNPASSGGATAVSFDNQLPTGFSYTSTSSIVLNGGTVAASRSTTVNPTAGSTRPTWGTFLIPPGAKVEINFTATIGASVPNGVYHDKAYSIYPDPLRTSANPNATITKSYGEANAAGIITETGGDITVIRRSVPLVWNLAPNQRIVRR